MTRGAVAAGVLLVLGCSPPRPPPVPVGKDTRIDSCHFEAALLNATENVIDVSARCEGAGLDGFRAVEKAAVPFISDVRAEDGRKLVLAGDRWLLDDGMPARIRYRVDLDSLGEAADDFDLALSLRGAVVAPVSTWMLQPVPTAPGAPVTLRVQTPPGARFATGLVRQGEVYRLETQEIRVATYSVFGRFQSSTLRLPAPGSWRGSEPPAARDATIEVTRIDAPMSMTGEALDTHIANVGLEIARFWGGFPVDHALLVVIPIRGREGLVFGKVLPAGGPGIVVMIGARSTEERLYRDWVLVHELFHLGFPSFFGEGKWLDEGLATYFEPIIRARAGWQTEKQVWREFLENMGKGLSAVENEGLENATSFRGIYWGGALICLAADVAARERSHGSRGLEHGIRRVLERGGSAPHVWDLDTAIRVTDEGLGGPILGKLALTYGRKGRPFDLAELFARLGVRRAYDDVVLDDAAPLAHVRRAIVGPTLEPPAAAKGAAALVER